MTCAASEQARPADLRHDQAWLNQERYEYDDLMRLMRFLLSEEGCPWDRSQTLQTLRQYMLEEAYEVADAIDRQDQDDLVEELGDIQFEIVFQMLVAERDLGIDVEQVITGIVQKMIRRHSHIFGSDEAATAEDVMLTWEENKRKERASRAAAQQAESSALDGVAQALPALVRSRKLASRAADHGFDWPDAETCLLKVDEELAEVREAMTLEGAERQKALTEEIGDLLQAVSNLARKLDIDAEEALYHSNNKFDSRYRAVEQAVWAAGRQVNELDLEGLEAYWQQIKREQHED